VSAPKPGNVHRGADFEDVTFLDFIAGAVVSGPVVERVGELGVGRTVLEAVQATRSVAASNTNLGTLLLIAPLAAACSPSPSGRGQVAGDSPWRGEGAAFVGGAPSPQPSPGGRGSKAADGIHSVLQSLTFDDTRYIYEAIRTAVAGGMGKRGKADVSEPPPADLQLVEAMRMAADRDLVARQYVNNFADVFRIADWIEEGTRRGWSRDTAVVHAYIRQLTHEPDSLIARKCGEDTARRAQTMASRVLEYGAPGEVAYHCGLEDFDFWLRSDGHRRNPGTTADLIAAGLFVLLREGRL
jgi:triphosphoribosyl-dephospho-CoA synthase